MSEASEPLLRADGLCVRYGQVEAVQSVSLEVGAAHIVSLVGSNGAGKTTTLRALSGLLPLASGRIFFAGQDITHMPVHLRVRAGLAHVPEGRHVFPELTVLENLQMGAYGCQAQAHSERRLDAMMELFPILADRRRQSAGTLSGGEQQMLAIGRALMSGPRLLILDEPTMGLSPKMIELVLETLATIRARRIPVLLVEQNTVEAIRMADAVYAMRVGRIVQRMPGHQVTEESLHQFYLG